MVCYAEKPRCIYTWKEGREKGGVPSSPLPFLVFREMNFQLSETDAKEKVNDMYQLLLCFLFFRQTRKLLLLPSLVKLMSSKEEKNGRREKKKKEEEERIPFLIFLQLSRRKEAATRAQDRSTGLHSFRFSTRFFFPWTILRWSRRRKGKKLTTLKSSEEKRENRSSMSLNPCSFSGVHTPIPRCTYTWMNDWERVTIPFFLPFFIHPHSPLSALEHAHTQSVNSC